VSNSNVTVRLCGLQSRSRPKESLETGHMSTNTFINPKKIICSALYVVLMLNVFGASCHADDNSQPDEVKNPTLQDELFKRVERDQEARFAAIAWEQEHGVDGVFDEDSLSDDEKATYAHFGSQITDIDTSNTEWLKGIVAEGGWPIYSEVGIDFIEPYVVSQGIEQSEADEWVADLHQQAQRGSYFYSLNSYALAAVKMA